MPKISVLMGIYNTTDEEMLTAAISSILNQTFNDFELIICDDGSTDETYQVVKKIVGDDKRVILINNDVNQGLAYSLNKCLSLAQGEYIARMDADDISLTSRFERQYNFLENNSEYVLVGCSAKLFDSNGVWGIRMARQAPQKKDFLFGSPFIHPSIMIKKDVLIELDGYRVAKETLRAEDYDLFMRLYAKGYIGYNIQEPLFQFREDEKAFSRRKYKFRLGEAKVRYRGFKQLGILMRGIPYIIKPLVVGLIPQTILKRLRGESLKH